MPTYLSFDGFETAIGGAEKLAGIADPEFTNDLADVEVVEGALDWAESELLRECRGAPDASGLASWIDTPASLPKGAKAVIISLAIYRIHEIIRGTEGFAIPKGSIDAKDNAYKTLEGLKDGSTSWSSSATPAKSLTQKTRVYVDAAGGRRASTAQIRKLIG